MDGANASLTTAGVARLSLAHATRGALAAAGWAARTATWNKKSQYRSYWPKYQSDCRLVFKTGKDNLEWPLTEIAYLH